MSEELLKEELSTLRVTRVNLERSYASAIHEAEHERHKRVRVERDAKEYKATVKAQYIILVLGAVCGVIGSGILGVFIGLGH